MTTFIHPTALISPSANIAEDVKIGAFTIIEDHVVIGSGSRIKSSAHICNNTLYRQDEWRIKENKKNS